METDTMLKLGETYRTSALTDKGWAYFDFTVTGMNEEGAITCEDKFIRYFTEEEKLERNDWIGNGFAVGEVHIEEDGTITQKNK